MVILYIILFFIIFSYILKKLAPYLVRYIIKKNLEKFQKHHNKKEPKKDFKFKSKKKVGEYIDYEEFLSDKVTEYKGIILQYMRGDNPIYLYAPINITDFDLSLIHI